MSNQYDIHDRVERRSVVLAAGLKIAVYGVRHPESNEWMEPQIHMTYDNTVYGAMPMWIAQKFAFFIENAVLPEGKESVRVYDNNDLNFFLRIDGDEQNWARTYYALNGGHVLAKMPDSAAKLFATYVDKFA